MIAQIFNPTAELVIPTGTQTNEANAEIERQPITVEVKIIKCSTIIKSSFYAFHSLNHFVLFLLKDSFLFHIYTF